jgi:capsular polysaccharide transport system permease protein
MPASAEKQTSEPRASGGDVMPLGSPERTVGSGSTKAHAEALRRTRSRRLLGRLALFVVLPTTLAGGYFGAMASNQYESHALFSVRSSELRPVLAMEGLLGGLAGGGGAGHDALAVRDYVLSRDMLLRLDKEHGFISHYKSTQADWLSRLPRDASLEDAYEYFGDKVAADYDQVSGAVTVRVRAFSPDKAKDITASILRYSEEMVNRLSDRERRDRTAYAETDVKKAESRLTQARQRILELQRKHGDFSPLQTASAAMEIRTQLEGELAKARAELMQLKSYMNDTAPQVLAATEKVKSISAQVSSESRRLVDPKKPEGLNTSFADFEAAMVEKEFAQKAYESTMATLEVARADADRQHRYLAVIATPSKPDESTYPHRVRSVLAAFVLSFLLLGIGSLIGAAVREHARL